MQNTKFRLPYTKLFSIMKMVATYQDVKIGWYNVDTRVTYTVTYEGGDINSKRVNSSGVPDGDYKVCIVNGGSKSITGAMQYEVK